ncbi:YbaN family protein [Halobacillus seohaensis]|uniref:YbaN family protein n=1 Tax=Halobacillus seohaensis TaxID=447421 RepID=A0ABW2EGJ2_9BACI
MKFLVKILLVIVGSLSLGLGIIGIVLPFIPTTPLLLLAAACFVRSSDTLYNWLMTNKYFGSYITNFREGKGIPLKAKIVGVTTLWISITYSAFFVVPLVFVKVIMLLVAAYFTWYMLSLKTLK